MLSPWTIAAWAVLIVLVGVGVAVWLLIGFTGGDADANQVQLDAIRTAGTIVVGTGGAAALLLAARRQRSTEIALKQKDHDQALREQVAEQTRRHQERVAAATEADAEARRITDLHIKAVEQVGSDKAPVRLGGLYALERLAQDHVEQRQTIVNVLCAYLRMPYTLPGDPPSADAGNQVHTVHRERIQEREVRLAAQRILAHHLRPGPYPDNLAATFWADIALDLTGATLIELDLTDCTTREASFDQATFAGHASFIKATFASYAGFTHATFTGNVEFTYATFTGDVEFKQVTFTGRHASFINATFAGDTLFDEATFAGSAFFNGVTLPSARYADHRTSSPWTDFDGARFARGAPPEVARFVSPPGEETEEDYVRETE